MKGTTKQIKWAKDIRDTAMKQMTATEKKAVCSTDSAVANRAKFWIDNRNKTGKEIAQFVTKYDELSKAYRAAAERCDGTAKSRISNELAKITRGWKV